MAKARMKQAVIPKFSSEAEEAAWWDVIGPKSSRKSGSA